MFSLIREKRGFGFKLHTIFLESKLEHELNDSRIKDEPLEEILDLMSVRLVPKASSKVLKTYSTENLTRADLKDTLFEYVKKTINDEKLG